LNEGEERRPTLHLAALNAARRQASGGYEGGGEYSSWLTQSQVLKLYFHSDPGALDHFVRQESPDEIGATVGDLVRDPTRERALTNFTLKPGCAPSQLSA
jgi:hypothetical protein